jgi:mRNA interferase MazF
MNPATRGEVWLADLGPTTGSHLQLGRRPVIILQTDDLLPLNTVVVIPLTTELRRAEYQNNVLLFAGEAGQDSDCVAMCHHIRALDRHALVHKIGDLTPERLNEVEAAVLFVLALPS